VIAGGDWLVLVMGEEGARFTAAVPEVIETGELRLIF
jgi:hypothetical protein